jgi:hypothetical protein
MRAPTSLPCFTADILEDLLRISADAKRYSMKNVDLRLL